MASFRHQNQVDIDTLSIANRNNNDVEFIRREWFTVSVGEVARAACLEDASKRKCTRLP
jgi:hypothetical protein